MADADMPKTVEAIIGSAFGAAGERCLAGSVLVPVGDAAGPLLDLGWASEPKKWPLGDGSKDGVEMGPLMTSDHCNRVRPVISIKASPKAQPRFATAVSTKRMAAISWDQPSSITSRAGNDHRQGRDLPDRYYL